MRTFFGLCWLCCLVISCSSPLNKTIGEELSIEELKSIHEKDTFFISFYELIRENIPYVMDTKTKEIEFSDITYKKLYMYVNTIIDTNFIGDINEISDEWNMKFPNVYSKIDSIKLYWNKFILDNSLSKYVGMEFIRCKKRPTKHGCFYEIGMNITPLQGEISEIHSDIRFISKTGEKNIDIHTCFEGPFNKSKIVYNAIFETEFENMCIENDINCIKQKYEIEYYISMAKYNGNYIFTPITIDKIPESYFKYLKDIHYGKIPMDYEISSLKHKEYSDDKLIQEMLYPDFISFNDYTQDIYLQKAKNINGKYYDFLCNIPDRNFFKWVNSFYKRNNPSIKEYIVTNLFFDMK